MRTLTGHEVNEANQLLKIEVMDEPGHGGACHHYRVTPTDRVPPNPIEIWFQNGPIKEHGINGLTHEALITIVIDRLQSFQAGPYACAANAQAIDDLMCAREELLSRTRGRQARSVEGTSQL